jgi:hypothetical protein
MTNFTKLSAAALTALVLAGAAAATPVLAGDSYGFDSATYIQQLRYDGINAIAADDGWNDTFSATVKLADGTTQLQFFDKASFQRVSASGGRL